MTFHQQFGHASSDRLQMIFTCLGNRDKECGIILQRIVNERKTFQRYSRTKPKPAVGLLLLRQYNETVVVNLHELQPDVWYLHIIDQFT